MADGQVKIPILFGGGSSNLYEYVINDPINFVDVSGLQWEYSQSTGDLYYINRETGERTYIGTGYAGHGEGLNNPDMQNERNVGPLPRGTYIIGEPYNNPRTGPYTMNLEPCEETEMYGIDLIRIHGDNSRNDQSASHGCPVFSRNIRERIHNSDDNEWRVIE